MEEINDLVGIKGLKIYQNNNWFKFSLESVLLPNFVTINLRFKKILDLCTGNAPIPLILSTRTKAFITGVEIQKDVAELAIKSIKINKLDNQIKIINDNLNNLKEKYSGDNFDLITVNPPYFPNLPKSLKNDDCHKTLSRHEITTTLDDIFKISVYLLKNGGYFAMVHRTERFIEIIEKLNKYNLIPKRIRFIYPKKNSKSNLFMIECIKNGKKDVNIEDPLYVHNLDGTYTLEVEKIFNIKEGE